jgi:hypothetical protein
MPPSSIYGALPASSTLSGPSLGPDIVSFHFCAFNPTILNCTVMGPRSLVYYNIVTDASRPNLTTLYDNQGASIAQVHWRTQPRLDIRGGISGQKVAEWLPPSSNKR